MNPLMQNRQNPMQMLSELKRNPSGILSQAGYRIPSEMSNPNEIVNYLLSSGQITNGRLASLQKMAQMAFKMP